MGRYETLPYQVKETHGKIEVREYDMYLLASTKTQANKYGDSGFSNVFRYITGGNKEHVKIRMTTPVVTYEEEGALVTGFYVPSKYNSSTVPEPTGNVYIKDYEKGLYAVIRFRGRWNKKNYDTHDQELLQFIKEKGYETRSPRMVFRYQPPMVPGVFRRNEIAYQIKKHV
jgi:hypothetical protein